MNSLNISDPEKMKKKLLSILNINADITILNDIRLSNKSHVVSDFLKHTDKGNFDFIFHSTKNARGVGIIINKKSNFEVNIVHKDIAENILLVTISKGEQQILVGAIYGPKQQDDINFIDNLMNTIEKFKHLPFILAGDFNLIPNTNYPLRDIHGSVSIPNPRNSRKIENLINNGELKDIFRELNGNVKDFSYMSFNKASSQRSRIDLSLCNSLMLRNIKSIKFVVLSKTLFDHKATILNFGGIPSKAMGANMNILDQPLTNTIIHVATLNAVLENSIPYEEGGEAQELLNNTNTKMIEIRSKLNICSTILTEAVKKNDKLLHEIFKSYETVLKKDLMLLPNIESLYKASKFNINDSLLLQVILNEITNSLKNFQAHYNRLQNHMVDLLHNDLRAEYNKSPPDPFKIYLLELKISEYETEKLNSWCARFNAWDILNREKTTKGFCAISKAMSKEINFNDTVKDTNFEPAREFKNNRELNKHTNDFYGSLFANNDNECKTDIDGFLSDLDLDNETLNKLKVPDELKKGLDREITIDEIAKSLKSTSGFSSPGMDGFSYDFIKRYFHLLKFPMLRCFEFWIRNERVSENFAISKIRLLPKKENLHKIQSWRPIALLSTFYKCFSGVFSNRLKPIADLINVLPQKAYSSVRNINEANVDLANIVNAASAQTVPMAVCALDFKKAFDSVSNAYVTELFRWMGMPPYLISMLKACILGKRAYITNLEDNNELFDLGRGFAQGDRPSGICFGICVNLAFFRILNHPKFIDVTIPLEKGFEGPENLLSNRISAFADDGNAKMAAKVSNLSLLKKIFTEFFHLSGLQTNFDKTVVIPFNAPPEFVAAIPEHGFRVATEFTTLGVDYSINHRDFIKKNEKNVEKKIEKIISFWKKIYLSLVGKVSVAKTFIYSQIAYLCIVIRFSDDFKKRIENMIIAFINTHLKVGKEKIFQSVTTGGLGLFKVDNYCESIRMSFFRRTVNNLDVWAAVINNCKDVYQENRFVEDEYLKVFFSASYNLLQTYNNFTDAHYMLRGNEGSIQIFNNKLVQDGHRPIPPPANPTQGDPRVTLNLVISDIVNNNNILKDRETLNTEKQINIDKRTYKRIKNGTSKIRKIYSKENELKSAKMGSILCSKTKGSKQFRKTLDSNKEKKTSNLKPTRTREKRFDFEHEPKTEKKLYKAWTEHYLNNDVRTYLYKMANNLTKMNIHLAKFNTEISENCKSCQLGGLKVREDFLHFYFECPTTINHVKNAKKIFLEDVKYEPSVVLINDKNNNATSFERTIAGIMCYVLYTYRNSDTNKINKMNDNFQKIISGSIRNSNFFKSKVERYINSCIDPF